MLFVKVVVKAVFEASVKLEKIKKLVTYFCFLIFKWLKVKHGTLKWVAFLERNLVGI